MKKTNPKKRKPKRITCPFYQNGKLCTNVIGCKRCIYFNNFEKCEIYRSSMTLLKEEKQS